MPAVRGWSAVAACVLAASAACHHPAIKRVVGPALPDAANVAALWREPDSPRDLFGGVGGAERSPDPRDQFTVIDVKEGSFSEGYTVTDTRGREWSVKFPPEAQPEVVVSRIVWGLGYHQVPTYLLPSWEAKRALGPNPQREARFRPKHIAIDGVALKEKGDWSYYQNPFVGRRELAGLLVLQVMLANSDLKDAQNVLYELEQPLEGSRVWYVARDLGHTFGRTGRVDAPRNDIEAFETGKFIRGVKDGFVQFEFHSRHGALVEHVTVADVRWICTRLSAFTDRQWNDAFRAGGYDPVMTGRFVRSLKQRIAQGLALPE
jgi:hypothetical protein